jgi:glutaminyl-peptide cyclotransferase
MKRLFTLMALATFFSCNNNSSDPTPEDTVPTGNGLAAPKQLQAILMAEYPHDTAAFTEGLLVHNGKLYESTGLMKQSFIQITDIKSGKIEKKIPLKDPSIFGEGINILGDKLYQLTYQNHVAYAYNLSDLTKPIQTFTWHSEGWGMTNNGTDLIISDGQASGNLYFVNPANFTTKRIIQVMDNNGPVDSINELEYINGFIYANVWGSTFILQIDPDNGHVIGKLETTDLLKSFYSSYPINWQELNNVLNGIAYDSTTKKMFITGKRWPKIFELKMN